MPEPSAADDESHLPEQAAERESAEIHHISARFAGPLPPPSILEGYEAILPGAAERILAMAERQAAHRQGLEKATVEAQIADMRPQRAERRLGQICGLVIGVVAILSGAVVAVLSDAVAGQISGGLIGAGGVAGLVSVFVLGRRLSGLGESERAP